VRDKLIWAFKIAIGVLCISLIGRKLGNSYSSENVGALLSIFAPQNLSLLLLSFVLLFVNWGLEVRKWSLITGETEKISFGKAWQSVWTGVCIGNLTPGRLGEFAGRILFFSPAVRARIATSHFVCGITQLVITVVIGCLGLVFFSSGLSQLTWFIALTTEMILLAALTIVLLRLNPVVNWIINRGWLKKFDFEGLSYTRPLLLKLIGLSLVRYLVFSFQFFLLLRACGIEGDIIHLGAAISIMYLLLSTIPMISMVEVAVRAYVAVLLFGMFHPNDWQLTAASTLLWLINIVVPSLIGYIFILKNNFTFSAKKNGMA
jgi:hypothetical protein